MFIGVYFCWQVAVAWQVFCCRVFIVLHTKYMLYKKGYLFNSSSTRVIWRLIIMRVIESYLSWTILTGSSIKTISIDTFIPLVKLEGQYKPSFYLKSNIRDCINCLLLNRTLICSLLWHIKPAVIVLIKHVQTYSFKKINESVDQFLKVCEVGCQLTVGHSGVYSNIKQSINICYIVF